ncbi:hypothetical protein AGDE_14434 [Angomonas deanei]|nr:hypothetical protein AGDE_14434 [Angomonas deanei]|eukprot:EPY20872.1 hypothetical protein AGDE_14434 [Angomonas deanei]
MVQRSVQSFEDAEWVRDQAARGFAQFHNNVEALHIALNTQLEALLKTAMQLNPDLLSSVRQQHHLRRTDTIPDGIVISDEQAEAIACQEEILADLATDLHQLRNTSVRFASHFLTDAEKRTMGANPAFLRAEDIDRAEESRLRRSSRSVSRITVPEYTPARTPISPKETEVSHPRPLSPFNRVAQKDDPYLVELRREYVRRIAELNGADGKQIDESANSKAKGKRKSKK